ncbi:hypothetical protein NL676_020202 [Syzygium grande]|nr:hypothetical protein NL676_020202 [Syzygium grande]
MAPADCVISLHTRGWLRGWLSWYLSHHVKASKVILSDGDLSTLSNMKLDLKMNQLSMDDDEPVSSECAESVKCYACLGSANMIYDPLCLPLLVRLLSVLVNKSKSSSQFPRAGCDSAIGGSHDYGDRCNASDVKAAYDSARNATKHLMAYILSAIHNDSTFNRFLGLLGEAKLAIADLTGTLQPTSLLPDMQLYDRSSRRLFKLLSK